MQKAKNQYIKYTRAELENYTNYSESCVKKIHATELIRFSPTIFTDFQSSIVKILSRKIGKYDLKLNGIVLDYRNTKIMGNQSGIRQDSPFSAINVESNFYVFSPQKGAIVTGVVKYINRMKMETVISVVIYRVFNVKVTVHGRVKRELEKNQEIQIRVKDFHFDNVIPFIEGELVDNDVVMSTKRLFDDAVDSGISESSVTSEVHKDQLQAGPSGIKIKQERESSVESNRYSKPKKSRKRKSSDGSDSIAAPSLKKIKTEPRDSSGEETFARIKTNDSRELPQEPSSTTKTNAKHKSKPTPEDSTIMPNDKISDNRSKEKKAKKKKTNRIVDDDDDFETSLQLLLNATQIKKEK